MLQSVVLGVLTAMQLWWTPLTVHAPSVADDEVVVGTLNEEDLAAIVVTDLEYR